METPGWKIAIRKVVSALGGTGALLLGIPLVALFLVMHARGHYLPHYGAEMFSVIVAASVFMLTWNARRFLDNHYFLFLGISCLFVGILDSLHALAFDGWIGGGSENDVQLWYAARYFQGVTLVMAPTFALRKIRPGLVFWAMAAVTITVFAGVSGGALQHWFRPGAHTWFMGLNDAVLFGLGVAAYVRLGKIRTMFHAEVYERLGLSILIAVLSGVAEGLGMRGFENLFLVGDLFLALSFYLVYKAVIETGLLRPYDLLFRDLQLREESARVARDELEVRVGRRTAELRRVNERLMRELDERKATERERETTIDLLRLVHGSRNIEELVAGLASFLRERIRCDSVGIRYRVGSAFPFLEDAGLQYRNAHSGVPLCPLGGEGDPVDAELPIPTRWCACGAIVPGGAAPSDPQFDGGKSFWMNSVSDVFARDDGLRRRVLRGRCRREEFESLALVPLRSGDEAFGFLQFSHRQRDLFTPDLIARLERLAGHVAAAVSQMMAKEALRESEDRFRSLVENVPVGILIVRNGRVVYRNPSVRLLFGDLPEPVRFRDIGSVLPEDREKFERICDAVERAGEGPGETDLRFLPSRADGEGASLRWVYCQTRQIEYRQRTASLVVLNDLTRMKDLEQIVSTREKLSIIGQMSAGIAHEIRNPLSGININISTLEHVVNNLEGGSQEDRSKIRAIVSQAKAASEKISTVIRRVMDFSKQVPPKLGRVDVNQVIQEALTFSSATLRKNRISVVESLCPGLPACMADPRLLEQVLLNLITNAVQAMEGSGEGRRLGIATGVEGRLVLIRVFDNGPGVPAQLRERIFDPFYTTRKAGHGIGLSFSRRVIENQGGELTVSGSGWGGAEFRIALAAAAEKSPA